ncbi:hypothetical protein EIKCOROL_00619 [Eikenella corrodens ATCC 23834]|uniref:Uncharacterized protein n=1 Tax=Eikenella corrodens ATCC 23834 TaxID=546274 RepID=C0DTE1_EIKCO|nr:hypothetical protein EIKCOROL_00619 [Eikenella corrodens ATCC 23834]
MKRLPENVAQRSFCVAKVSGSLYCRKACTVCRVRATGTHAVVRYSKAVCVRTVHTLHPQMSRLPEIHFSGSLFCRRTTRNCCDRCITKESLSNPSLQSLPRCLSGRKR